MTHLVTGATGFVGAAVVRSLLKRGEKVRVLARPNSDRRNLAGLNVEVAEGDLLDPNSLASAVSGVEGLFHVAADYRIWVPDPEHIYAVNVAGSRSLMKAALEAGISRIVYTSSVATLGLTGSDLPADEDTPVAESHMIGHYKRSKYLAEEAVKEMVKQEALPAVIVNPSTPIGPRDVKPTPTGRMIVEAASDKMPAYVESGLNLVHVDDVAEGHLLAYNKGTVGERYILGGENLALSQIFGEVARIRGHKPPKISLPQGLLMPLAHIVEAWARLTKPAKDPFLTVDGLKMSRKLMYFSHAKAASQLGYQPRPALDALKDAIEWFDEQGYVKG
ncbi:MAG: hopanoid-associated sugar epimerase [Pseudomonadota bacterium]